MNHKQSANIYTRRINRVIDHICDHLDEPLPLHSLARIAYFSPFHFHRIFRSLVGEPLHAFILRLRLEKAIFQMQHGPPATLTEIALRCGFSSSSDFSRAFKQAYGFSPREYTHEKFVKNSKIRQDLAFNAGYGFGPLPAARNPDRFRVRLVDRPAHRIAFVRVIGGFNAEKIGAGFERLMTWGRRHGLVPSAQLIGMSQDDSDITPMKKYRFDWCLILPPDLKPEGEDGEVSVGAIPANRFAAVHVRGDIQKELQAWQYLFHDWLPRSGYQPTHDPAMELYRAHPLEIGWERFDMDCCVPVRPLARR
jgi:DNA gyrase inhibitor GyrI/AraC-like DNA-binding protein